MNLLQDESVPRLYETRHVGLPHSGRVCEDEPEGGGFRDGPETPQEVARLAGETDGVVHHVEEEGELAADAVLSGAAVVEDQDAQFLRVVEDLQHGVRVRVREAGFQPTEPSPVVSVECR